uniref:Uncharacterized protein n=1 Tax=Ascaris lumbricoides TaxID=6252 RepID=A0A0M3HM54_ASCLU
MGVIPNTSLVDRIHSRREKLSQEISTTSKRGEHIFIHKYFFISFHFF